MLQNNSVSASTATTDAAKMNPEWVKSSDEVRRWRSLDSQGRVLYQQAHVCEGLWMMLFIEQPCSKFLLKGSLFILTLILLFRSKVNILKFPACLGKQVEGVLLGQVCWYVCVCTRIWPSSKTLYGDLILIKSGDPCPVSRVNAALLFILGHMDSA